MPTRECLDTRRNAMLLSVCVLTDGPHQERCCDCEHREIQTCDIMLGKIKGMEQCKDCSFPKVILNE